MSGKHQTKYLDNGKLNPKWKPRASHKNASRFASGHFVAIDGEGHNTEEILDNNGTHRHIYTLLAASDGTTTQSISSEHSPLSTAECLKFLVQQSKQYPNGIFISFSFMYDVVHILRDMPRNELERALSDDQAVFGRYGMYLVKYRPRKFLHIIRLNNISKREKDVSIVLWDTFGFFQSSFITALEQWGIAIPEEIIAGKQGRSDFSMWSMTDIAAYNKLELVLLVGLMNKVREAAQRLNITLRRWDGAGALATAIYQKELPKEYIRSIELPEEIDKAAHYAYFGGRIETMQYGHYDGTVYKYDINSAYPDIIRKLPNLKGAHWNRIASVSKDMPAHDFSLIKMRWQFTKEYPFYPFAWRSHDGSVTFPKDGYGYMWGIEYNLAYKSGIMKDCNYTIEEYYYPTLVRGKPFRFVETYYSKRQALKVRIREQNDDNARGESLMIKLGLNSLYGKMAQKIGYNEETKRRPPFYNACYAGYITASTRAMLFYTAFSKRDSIISFATDGIFSTERLEVDTGSGLGQWEEDTYDTITHIQSGYYYLHSGGKIIEYCRGIDKAHTEEEKRARECDILAHWQKYGLQDRTYPMTRLIGLKIALKRQGLYAMRGWWYREDKLLETGGGKKRTTKENPNKVKPHKRLIQTVSNPLESDGSTLSTIARTPWDGDYEIEEEAWGL